MGAWSGEPFGNDSAVDWSYDLDDLDDWSLVRDALMVVSAEETGIDQDAATNAIAASEVVAHGLGRPTQDDAYTRSVAAFVQRVTPPDPELVHLASSGLEAAISPGSELTELWGESDPVEWEEANAKLAKALRTSG